MKRLLRLILAILLLGSGVSFAANGDEPVWLLGNNFHTSVALRTRDVPFRNQVAPGTSDELVIGWGAAGYYRGPGTTGQLIRVIFPGPSVIHVVPTSGPLTRSFPHSDIVELWLSPASFAILLREIADSFAYTKDHRLIDMGQGDSTIGRFYASHETFYFPYVCNMWVAVKLNHAGGRFCLCRAITSSPLIRQAQKKGITLQHYDGKGEGY
jgi:hypothetical protein